MPPLNNLIATIGALAVGACAVPVAPCPLPATAGPRVTLIAHGWHVDIGLRAAGLAGPLANFRDLFPVATAFVFGYGKRTFLAAPPDSMSEYLLGPVPGAALIEVIALTVPPDAAYLASDTITLNLSQAGAVALSDFIWRDLGKDSRQNPLLVGPGNFPGGLFYAARSEYTLFHTCNTWAADALHAAGLPVSGGGVVFSGAVISQAAVARGNDCRPEPSRPRQNDPAQ